MPYDFRDPREQSEALGIPREAAVTQSSIGGSIMNELVKSYGFRRDETSGDWSWSIGNIGKAFEEDPFWSAVDWAAVVVSPLKIGTAAAGLAKGAKAAKAGKQASAVASAYAAGEFAGQAPKLGRFSVAKRIAASQAAQRIGRPLGLELGPEAMAAAQFAEKGVGFGTSAATGRVARYFSSPLTQQFDSDYLALIDKYGGSVAERRGVIKQMEREAQLGGLMREGLDVQRKLKTVRGPEREKFARLLEGGVGPTGKAGRRAMALLGDDAAEAYRATWTYRNKIHDQAFATGMISEEVYKKNLKTYYPRMYEEFLAYEEARKAAGMVPAAKGAGLGNRFKPRKLSPAEQAALTKIMDPAVGVNALMDAAQVIGAQRYAHGLASSALAKTADEVAQIVTSGDAQRMALHGIDEKRFDVLAKYSNAQTRLGRDITDKKIAEELGWLPVDKLFKSTDNIPEELRGKWLDPIVAKDVRDTLSYMQNPSTIAKFVNRVGAQFRASKTAYNPATHMRNFLGAAVFHHVAVGGHPFRLPKQGFEILRGGDQSEWYRAARDAGLLQETFDADLRHQLVRAGYKKGGAGSAMDWFEDATKAVFGEGGRAARAGEAVTSAASRAETFYREIDEVFRLDAWKRLSERYHKGGLTMNEARARALADVHKFTPSFSQHSKFTDDFKELVPFMSFTSESLRVWKNTFVEKPHLAYFWANFADVASHAAGAAAGFSEEDLEVAKNGLPHYMNNKKLLAMPFKVDGKPQFLDLSYVIPLANMSEGMEEGSLFFDELYSPASNPFFSFGAALTTGVDPFSGREIGPQMTAGLVTTTNETARKAVGLVEHAARTMGSPVMGGYASQNILEAVRGTKSGITGSPEEGHMGKTLLANLAGLRLYEPQVNSLIQNQRHEAGRASKGISQAWRRWEKAEANGDLAAMEIERQRIITLKSSTGEDGEAYFTKMAKQHKPGSKYKVKRGISKRRTAEAVETAESLERRGMLSPDDLRLLEELR